LAPFGVTNRIWEEGESLDPQLAEAVRKGWIIQEEIFGAPVSHAAVFGATPSLQSADVFEKTQKPEIEVESNNDAEVDPTAETEEKEPVAEEEITRTGRKRRARRKS